MKRQEDILGFKVHSVGEEDFAKIQEAYNKKIERQKKAAEFFKTLKEGVDYKRVKTDIDSPLEVFKIVPISEKGEKYFTRDF